ncbi:esterase [Methylopila jiangsuensis]|uniref:Esterase n=1 Tax=Methylopila jiangsuensis TaxID=586230 RepID=A0A9W6N5F9_9HYPH|nr:alpha/beta hydrolase-fold protein [Methylopila jiangsuensis]MDR6284437.1 S-formylglutathione hydrolase FrmB [Methylopila jiangsuensis]GLK78177.1 esterase [Methylopila jiangsuensis]
MPLRLLVLLLTFATPATAQPPMSGGSTVQRSLAMPSAALGQPVRYSVYLPAGYARSGLRYPVIYLLHGFGGDDLSFFDSGDLQEVADRLAAEGELPPAIIVTPSAKKGWYVDNAETGRWETALLDDLVDGVDAQYRTLAKREGRAVAGYSMGGYGALRFALLEPERFVAAGSLSGALFPDVKAATDFPAFQLAFFGRAFGATFDPKTFNAASPWRLLADDAADAPALYMSVGDRDIGILAEGNAAFEKALAAARIPVTYSVAPGGHDWALWGSQLAPMLEFLGKRLAKPLPADAPNEPERSAAVPRKDALGPATPTMPKLGVQTAPAR